jgi:hypothetical protein
MGVLSPGRAHMECIWDPASRRPEALEAEPSSFPSRLAKFGKGQLQTSVQTSTDDHTVSIADNSVVRFRRQLLDERRLLSMESPSLGSSLLQDNLEGDGSTRAPEPALIQRFFRQVKQIHESDSGP